MPPQSTGPGERAGIGRAPTGTTLTGSATSAASAALHSAKCRPAIATAPLFRAIPSNTGGNGAGAWDQASSLWLSVPEPRSFLLPCFLLPSLLPVPTSLSSRVSRHCASPSVQTDKDRAQVTAFTQRTGCGRRLLCRPVPLLRVFIAQGLTFLGPDFAWPRKLVRRRGRPCQRAPAT